MVPAPSLLMRLTILFLKVQGNDLNARGFPRWRREVERRAYPSPARMPRDFHTRFRVQERQVNGQPVYVLLPSAESSQFTIIYTHGGAYVAALISAHWDIIGKLIERVGARVIVPIYPLAPEHNYRETFPLLEEVYRSALRDRPDDRIALCGDSAGGGLALAQAMHYRDLGLRLPDRVVLFSPWVDITMSNPGAAAVEPQDVILGSPGLVQCGRWWAGGDDPHSPLLSPIFGDLSGLPPIDIFQGTRDVLIADARKLCEKVTAAGGAIRLFEYPGAFHVFVGATFTPEAKDAFDHVATALRLRPVA